MTNTPLSKRIISKKTPYFVQEWDNVEQKWVNRRRAVNLDMAIKRYYEEMEKRRLSYSAATVAKMHKQRPIRLFDTLYDEPIGDKDVMARANKSAAKSVRNWDLAAKNALKLMILEKRELN